MSRLNGIVGRFRRMRAPAVGKRRCWLVLLALAALAGGCGSPTSTLEPPVRQALNRARRLLEADKVGLAEKEFRRAITLTSHKADVYLLAIDGNLEAMPRLRSLAARPAADFAHEALDLSDHRKLDRPLTTDELKGLLKLYGELCYELQRRQEALKAFERAIRLSPKNAELANDLGYSYAESDMRLSRALDLTRQAVRSSPGNGMYVDSLGWVYYKLGRYNDAVRELRRAVELTPDNADIRFHLGAAYARKGRRVEAEIEFRKALICDPMHVGARVWLDELRKPRLTNMHKV